MSTPKPSRFTPVRRAAALLSPLDYAATSLLVGVYAVGTSLDEGPKTSLDYYRSAATVTPSLLIAVAVSDASLNWRASRRSGIDAETGTVVGRLVRTLHPTRSTSAWRTGVWPEPELTT